MSATKQLKIHEAETPSLRPRSGEVSAISAFNERTVQAECLDFLLSVDI